MPEAALSGFGRRLRILRLERGLSQEGLADRAALHRTYVGGIERGERNVSLLNIVAIAAALGVKVAELLAEVDAPQVRKNATQSTRRIRRR